MSPVATKSFARLPTNVVPIKYHLNYDVIDLMGFRFEATEHVELRVDQDTTQITCHAVDLFVFDVSIAYAVESEQYKQTADSITHLRADESVQLQFAQAVPAGTQNVVLSLRFQGFLGEKPRGFYRSEYAWAGNESRTVAVTQFQACDARRAFVCWDEPAIKASYEISMVTDPELTALSNTHVVETQLRPKKNAHLRKNTRSDSGMEKWWKFAETPIMSTYLVAMIVGEFDVISRVSEDDVLVNVYTPLGKSELGRFALDVTVRGLTYCSKLFGIPYPLKKLDMVTIPEFLGAMENWGLVPCMESYLLMDDKTTSHAQRVDAARTICHELTHQWFGNLVTMEWWTGLWLNEGFAHFMEYDAVDHLFPEWKVWDSFVQKTMMGSALHKDCLHSSHPIEVEVNHPSEADEIFDAISYAKGASLVRMLSEYLGRDVFFQGIHEYFVKHSYQNTVTEDLWAALEHASGQDIRDMANTWTLQTGYQLVELQQRDDNTYAITQQRFFAEKAMKGDDASTWNIPLTLVTSDDPTRVERVGIWTGKTASPVDRATPLTADEATNAKLCVRSGPDRWIKLNPGQSGYYLVNYPKAMWKNLEAPVKDKTLGVVDRLSLLSSMYALAGAGVVPMSAALDFTSAFAKETAHLCWRELAKHLTALCTMFEGDACFPKFQAFVRSLFSDLMTELTWNPAVGESGDVGEFRSDVILILGRAGDSAVISEAKRRFATFVRGDSSALSADLRLAVFKINGWNSGEVHVKELQRLLETSGSTAVKRDCLLALGAVSCPKQKQLVLDWAITSLRPADIPRLFIGFGEDPIGRELAWQCIQANWELMTSKYSNLTVGRLISAVVSHFQSEAEANQVETFLAPRNTTAFARRVDDALESARINSTRHARDRDVLAAWLQARQ
ncbi:TPA: hypothetical protein N0F65_000133 [Lagenidium giganteum]|uniref:Aminopeptidase n=1 Tax=Lagenidium giganteum TaxID=4803 RepID=A0AAV2YYP8_9STRA|nr:TPA: hypothetical protein N0F65_000133 [Lagenidium giganteum]